MIFIWGIILLTFLPGFGIGSLSEAEKFQIREELSIGVSEGDTEYIFSRISAVAVDDREKIYVLDYNEAELKVFDRDGKYLKTIGRRGQGPGEFSSPFSMGITAENTIMVHDLMNRRINYFSFEGKFINSFSTADTVMVGCDVDDMGNIISLVFTSGPGEQILELKRFDSEKKTLATYLTITKTGREALNNPLGPDLHWTRYLEDRLICGYAQTYKLRVFDLEGNEIRTIEHDYKPVRISQEEIDALNKMLPAAVDVQVPRYRPAFQGLTADEEGRVFVATWERPQSGKGYLYDVFDRNGAFVTRIELEYPPKIWKNSFLYSIEEDAEGYPVVKKHKVSWRSE